MHKIVNITVIMSENTNDPNSIRTFGVVAVGPVGIVSNVEIYDHEKKNEIPELVSIEIQRSLAKLFKK